MPVAKSKRFPLWYHAGSRQWGKKRHGKYYYFGSDKSKALDRYLAEWPAIKSGQVPRPTAGDDVTLRDVVNHFLTAKKAAYDAGKLSAASWSHYTRTAKILIAHFGRECRVAALRPDDFAGFARTLDGYRPETVSGIVTRVRTIFKHAYDYELLEKPVRYGPGLAKPRQREIRLARTSKLLKPMDIRRLIEAAGVHVKAMILLAINCGYGQSDISQLPLKALERQGWADFPRPKTGIPRRCPLWPETQRALEAAIAERRTPESKDDADLVFINAFGRRYIRYNPGDVEKAGNRTDGIALEYGKLAKRLKVPTGFYRLRHTHRTASDAAKDRGAADAIMGHVDATMRGVYVEAIDDGRLKTVASTVRKWLFGKKV